MAILFLVNRDFNFIYVFYFPWIVKGPLYIPWNVLQTTTALLSDPLKVRRDNMDKHPIPEAIAIFQVASWLLHDLLLRDWLWKREKLRDEIIYIVSAGEIYNVSGEGREASSYGGKSCELLAWLADITWEFSDTRYRWSSAYFHPGIKTVRNTLLNSRQYEMEAHCTSQHRLQRSNT